MMKQEVSKEDIVVDEAGTPFCITFDFDFFGR